MQTSKTLKIESSRAEILRAACSRVALALPLPVVGCTMSWLMLLCCARTTTAEEIDFDRDIRPILSDVCFQCHGPDAQKRPTEFRLDLQRAAFRDVEGGPAIVAGDAVGSQLYQRIISKEPDTQMPPPDSGRSLTAAQLQLLRQWIDEGAEWQEHWAFIPPQRPALPQVTDPTWCRNEIDYFVLARLLRAGQSPSPTADRSTLIRRATLDLTGLPATLAEVDAFTADDSPQAWEHLIDRLLKSPRYGERMASEWLDAARYADTSGYQTDGPRDMWRWRDWVIGAFNANMPFDRFTIEQLAGDLLPNPSLSQRIATGFNRNHRGNAEGGVIPEEYQVEYVVDRVDTTATVWLGLTMGCARCHDHKYDPVTQRDFYRVFAYFNNIPESGRAIKEGNSPPFIKAPTTEQQARLQQLDDRVGELEQQVRNLSPELQRQQLVWEASGIAPDAKMTDWVFPAGLVAHLTCDGQLPEAFHHETAKALEGEQDRGDAGVAFGPGQRNQAVLLDGSDFLSADGIAGFGYFQSFTISAWIRPTQPTGTIVSRMIPIEEGSGYSFQLQDGRLQVNLVKRWLDDAIRVETRDQLAQNVWQHVAMTYDGSRTAAGIRVYLDGKSMPLTVHLDGINQSFDTEEPLRIGGGLAGFSGGIDDVQIHDRCLSAEELQVVAEPLTVQQIAALDRKARRPRQLRKLTHYFVMHGASAQIRKAHAALAEARRERDQFYAAIPTVMVMEEMAQPRPTFVLSRGRYDARTEQVTAGVPEFLPPLPEGVPNNRLGFAEWLVSPNHPLTARVAVNRIWQMYFGVGLVKTTEDFGAQGDAPSHPELLDWLATEFIRSGWDPKSLHRLIVNSATYRQSSVATEELLGLDPENRLLARGPRFRLPAEFVRDQALYVGGLLNESIGGPSVRPYQPEGLWKEIASTTEYDQSHGNDLYRRSLYTYWKRTVAPPTMVTFDATSRESCTVKRSRTNTPLQALAIMNDVTFVEAARALAQRVLLIDSETSEDKMVQAFRLATGRLPTSKELLVLTSSLNYYRTEFQNHSEAAEKLLTVGESAVPAGLDGAELAAWTSVTSMILNLDEVLTKE